MKNCTQYSTRVFARTHYIISVYKGFTAVHLYRIDPLESIIQPLILRF